MFYNVVIRDAVHDDINDLSDYIFRFSFSREIAKKIYDDLYSNIFSLNFMPNRYEIYFWEYRRIIVKWSYKIIYKVDEKNKKVIIIRVFRVELENNSI